MREICLDIETTGLEPRDGHRIIEIGCVELNNKVKTGNNYHKFINPEREVPQEAFKIHGISTEFLQNKPKFSEIAKDFLDFTRDTRLVIHNASFDMKFINHELRNLGLEIIERSFVTDSLEIARNKFPGAGNSLDALCKRFNINLSRRVKHGALLDAELLADVYLELMGGSQSFMFEVSNPINNNIANNQNPNQISTQRTKLELAERNFQASDQEIALHQEFIIKNFKSNLWGY